MEHSHVVNSNLWSTERAPSESESNASLGSSYYSDISTDCTLPSDDEDMFLFDGPPPAETMFDMKAYFATRPLSDHPESSDDPESDDGFEDMLLFDGPQPAETMFDMEAYFATRPLSDHLESSDDAESDDGLDDDADAVVAPERPQGAGFVTIRESDRVPAARQINLYESSGDDRSPSHTRSCSSYFDKLHAVHPRIRSHEPSRGEGWSNGSSYLRDFMGRKQRLEADESMGSDVLVEQAGGRASSSACRLDEAVVIEDVERVSERAEEPARPRGSRLSL